MAVGSLARQPAGMIHSCEDVFGLLQEYSAGVRDRYMMAAAIEQLDPELLLELPDLLTQRRLGRAQSGRSACKAQLFSDRDKVTQMTEFHARQASGGHWFPQVGPPRESGLLGT
jgi:hypothetical protein